MIGAIGKGPVAVGVGHHADAVIDGVQEPARRVRAIGREAPSHNRPPFAQHAPGREGAEPEPATHPRYDGLADQTAPRSVG